MSDVAAAAPPMVKEAVQVMKVTQADAGGRSVQPQADVNMLFYRPSNRCRGRLKASATSSTPTPVPPRWRSTRKCSGTTANQMLACCRRAGPIGADSQSEEL